MDQVGKDPAAIAVLRKRQMGTAFFEAGRPLVQILSQLLPLFDRLHDWPSSARHSKVSSFYCFFS